MRLSDRIFAVRELSQYQFNVYVRFSKAARLSLEPPHSTLVMPRTALLKYQRAKKQKKVFDQNFKFDLQHFVGSGPQAVTFL